MIELIENKVLGRNWTFAEIANLKVLIEDISKEVYSEMTLVERFKLVRETKINDEQVGITYEDSFRQIAMTHLRGEVAGTIKNMLDTATVNFGDKNEISERSLGGEPHKERPPDEEKDSKD